jgi:peptide chain release factor 3
MINKMDRAGRDPLELLDEIERILGIPCSPANWPIGSGTDFQGVYDRWGKRLLRFDRGGEAGSRIAPVSMASLDQAGEMLGERAAATLRDELALLDGAGGDFDRERFLNGKQTPTFFASAMTNFGVEPFLEAFVDLAPSPRPRLTVGAGIVEPQENDFSAFVFKIQANMDPNHRDRIAFARVASGRFQRGMQVQHVRTDKKLTLARSIQFMGQERVQIEEAFAGDVIGLWDPGVLRIGDSLCEIKPHEFEGIPRFSPEHFVRVRLTDPTRRKQLKKGLDQLSEEGAVQLYFDRKRLERDPILGAVGVLQFEVTQHRLQSEYGVSIAFDRLPYSHARWIEGEHTPELLSKLERTGRTLCLIDVEERPLVLFETDWHMRTAENDHPELKFVAAVQPGRSARAA